MTSPKVSAIVRPPGDSFARAVSTHPDRTRIDVGLARRQHAAYCDLLAQAGADVIPLPADECHPDACFTQDGVVVLQGHALLLRFGVPSRRGEERSVAEAIAPRLRSVSVMAVPATLEGGDVLVLGSQVVVGRSRRSNDAGIAALVAFAQPLGFQVVTAHVPAWALHLTTAVTAVGESLVLGDAQVLEQPAFAGVDHIVVPDDDRLACNVVSIGQHVIAAGEHAVHRQLASRGLSVHPADLSEFNLADGSPTCLSLLLDPPGWGG